MACLQGNSRIAGYDLDAAFGDYISVLSPAMGGYRVREVGLYD